MHVFFLFCVFGSWLGLITITAALSLTRTPVRSTRRSVRFHDLHGNSTGLDWIGLGPLAAAGDTREEKVFRMWINSLAIDNGDLYINNLFADVQNGSAILKVRTVVGSGLRAVCVMLPSLLPSVLTFHRLQ